MWVQGYRQDSRLPARPGIIKIYPQINSVVTPTAMALNRTVVFEKERLEEGDIDNVVVIVYIFIVHLSDSYAWYSENLPLAIQSLDRRDLRKVI